MEVVIRKIGKTVRIFTLYLSVLLYLNCLKLLIYHPISRKTIPSSGV